MIDAPDVRGQASYHRPVRMVLMTLFGLEALLGAQTLARFIMVAPSYTALVWLMMALRGLVTLGQGMVVMLLGRRAPPTAIFARAVVIASALILTLEVG